MVSIVALVLLASANARADDRDVLRTRIASFTSAEEPMIDGAPIAALRGIAALYERRGWQPAWTDRAMVRELHDQVRRSAEHGLIPDDFHARQIGARLQASATDATYRADTEILCTDALARLAVTIEFGKLDPSSLDRAWNFSRSVEGQDVISLVNAALNSGDIAAAFEAIEPDLVEYDRLQRALADYRAIEARGGWPSISEGKGLELGSTGSRVVALRQRLKVTADLVGSDHADPAAFDASLEAAVKRFQRRHGIDVDGKVGPRSLEELNVPVASRIDQIRANLERARWVFRDVEDTYIIVDIAGYRLDLVEEGQNTWSTNVQVGKSYHATPVFKSAVKYVEFNPTWTIPPGILRKETLPRIRKDPGYLSRNNMSVVTMSGKIVDPATIDWAGPPARAFRT